MPVVDEAAAIASPVRILLIEDDPRAALLLGEMLRMIWTEGLILAHTERLSDATHELLEHGASCVILDLSIPGADNAGSIEHGSPRSTGCPDRRARRTRRRRGSGSRDPSRRAGLPAQAHPVPGAAEACAAPRDRAQSLRGASRSPRVARSAHRAAQSRSVPRPPGVALDRSRRTNIPVAVMFLDVDNFKASTTRSATPPATSC